METLHEDEFTIKLETGEAQIAGALRKGKMEGPERRLEGAVRPGDSQQ
jgi:hypothetical protein